jgi:hypothetical protein
MTRWHRVTTRQWQRVDAGPPVGAGLRFVPFSLFEGDLVNRFFAAVGLGNRRAGHLALRSLILICVTWLPMALMAPADKLASLEVSGRNFFADFAAYAQFLVGLPLFVVAESVVARATRDAAHQFLLSDVVRPADQAVILAAHARLARLRHSFWSDAACLAIAATLTFFIWHTEIGFPDDKLTWHTTFVRGAGREFTRAGAWEFFVALPIQMYWWLRIIWKIGLWYAYLRAVTALRLDLRPSHPDSMGGIGFVSSVQGRFSLVILAYGISNVAATVGYKLAIEGADLRMPPVWGPIVGFIVIAPLLFTLPLLRFTHQLRVAKERALRRYREMAMDHVRQTETLLAEHAMRRQPERLKSAFAEAVGVWKMFEQTQAMRIVPFDWRSFGQLMGSTFGSMATLLPLLHAEGTLPKWLELVSKLFQLLTGH